MYSYAYNNPTTLTDRNGDWPPGIHNEIIDAAFPGLTASQRQVLKDASAHVDSLLAGGQGDSAAPDHAMRSQQTAVQAEVEYQAFVDTNEDEATQAQMSFWAEGNAAYSNDALYKFGLALHAILDSTSPAHTGFQKWDWRNPIRDVRHSFAEHSISAQQMAAAVLAAQAAFSRTFSVPYLEMLSAGGPRGGQFPVVTSRICYETQLSDGLFTTVCE
jgi:hypothetical protein